MRVVITGATGNVGACLVQALLDDGGHEVVGLARRRPAWSPPGVRWEQADITTTDLVPLFRGADAVVHLAWLIQPAHDPEALWRTNVGGTTRVLDAVAATGVRRFVHASSVGAYAPGPKDARVGEDHPTDGIPTLGYAWQKAYCERLLDRFEAEHPGTAVVRLRPGLMFRRDAAREIRQLFLAPLVPTRLLPTRPVRALVERAPIAFQVVHTADAARAFALAVTTDVTGAFNIATEPPLGRRHAPPRAFVAPVRALVTAAHAGRLLATSPGWIDLAAAVPIMDTTRAQRELGWQPTRDARQTVEELIDGFRAGARGPTPPLDP